MGGGIAVFDFRCESMPTDEMWSVPNLAAGAQNSLMPRLHEISWMCY